MSSKSSDSSEQCIAIVEDHEEWPPLCSSNSFWLHNFTTNGATSLQAWCCQFTSELLAVSDICSTKLVQPSNSADFYCGGWCVGWSSHLCPISIMLWT
jgi:hypothetical protein